MKAPLQVEQLEDKGLATVMKAIEKGIEPDDRVLGKEAHAI